MLIRTGGDQRISNFLLYQTAYSELFFSPIAWPDYSPKHFKEHLDEFSSRHRSFGNVVVKEEKRKKIGVATMDKFILVTNLVCLCMLAYFFLTSGLVYFNEVLREGYSLDYNRSSHNPYTSVVSVVV